VNALDARWDAQEAVLNAKPQTEAGALALLIFLAEYLAVVAGDLMCGEA